MTAYSGDIGNTFGLEILDRFEPARLVVEGAEIVVHAEYERPNLKPRMADSVSGMLNRLDDLQESLIR